ncbi:EutN/CcmL family microcompartment protein [Desulfotomaculum sp. 1211_IL3151]|uniref:EutN/CcmL family microcompartment protein n=1 Tax=Desulfotomaculum sp. 1211_IL3151 TaxID=3084055 RepID=UPI002FD9D7D6
MLIGRVVSNVWSTRKVDSLSGIKFMIVEILDTLLDAEEEDKRKKRRNVLVAADLVGAGVGEKVLITSGSSSRRIKEFEEVPIDAAIIGIIDEKQS